jgi:3-oxoadipate enol-lactonase
LTGKQDREEDDAQMSRLAYELTGPADAPVVVLGNSLGTTRAMWSPQLPALAENFRVLSYDQLGHGRSEVPPGAYTVEQLGTELLSLLDELGVGDFHYAGLSLGGMVGMWLGANAASRVDSLVLMCTSDYLGPEAGYAERAQAVRAQGIGFIVDTVIDRWFTPEFIRREPSTVESTRAMLAATPPEGYAGCCDALATMDLRADLAKISAPTLVIGGKEDPAIPPAHQERVAEAVPGAQLELLAEAAHLANLEQPDRVTELLAGHLGQA